MAAQLNFPRCNNRFITVTYQSNNYLNEELDNKVKQNIASVIVEVVDVKNIHSYVHGQIIVEVSNVNPIVSLKKIIRALSIPMSSLTPALLYSVDITSTVGEAPNLVSNLYVNGDSEMNTNFLESIKEFYPPKK